MPLPGKEAAAGPAPLNRDSGSPSGLPYGNVLVAIADKHARQVWAMLARGEAYDPEAWLKHPMVQRA